MTCDESFPFLRLSWMMFIRTKRSNAIQFILLWTTLITELGNSVQEAIICGGVLNETSGEITSPFYPKNYPTNVTCEWTIAGGNSHLNLTFLDFQLEDSSRCEKFDFLEVELSFRSSGRICGSTLSGQVWSLPVAGQELRVKFHSDTTLTNRGFKMHYIKYDVNPCLLRNGDCQHHCFFFGGRKNCGCRKGYYLKYDGKSCEDIDECYSWKRRHACLNKLCVNTVGSFRCECQAGFRMIRAFHVCVDIDECSENNGDCQHSCRNRLGGYRCLCNRGFYRDDDGKNCHKMQPLRRIRMRTRQRRHRV